MRKIDMRTTLGRMLKKAVWQTFPNSRGSVSAPYHAVSFLSRARQRVVFGLFRRPVGEHGQGLVEFSLILPLLFLLIVNVVNFGALLYAWIAVANGARTAAQYMSQGPATVGFQTLPSTTKVQQLLTDPTDGDLKSLPEKASIVITVCSNNKGKAQAPQTCLASVADPEPNTSVVGTVNVSYTYKPLIPSWEFPALKIHSTLPAAGVTIHGKAAFRILQ